MSPFPPIAASGMHESIQQSGASLVLRSKTGGNVKEVLPPQNVGELAVLSDESYCPICNLAVKGPRFFYGGSPLWFCDDCALYFAPREISPPGSTSKQLAEKPGSLYDELYATSAEYQSLLRQARRSDRPSRMAFCEQIFFRTFPQPLGAGRLLDVGCGPGHFLRFASERGWKVQGVEIACSAVEVARSFGLMVFHGSLEEFLEKNPAPNFDAAVAFEVLEHLEDPLGFLKLLAKAVAGKGVVAISVPNALDPFVFLDPRPEVQPPVHLQFFTRKAIHKALERAGLVPITVRTNFLPRPTMRKVMPSRIQRAVWKIPLAFLRILGLVEGHQIVGIGKRA